jgi:hypothetical protein
MDSSRSDEVLRTLSVHRSRRAVGHPDGHPRRHAPGDGAGKAQTVCLIVSQTCKPRGK